MNVVLFPKFIIFLIISISIFIWATKKASYGLLDSILIVRRDIMIDVGQ